MNIENTFLEIAEFTKTQGLKGEIRAKTFCDSPEIIGNFTRFFIGESKTPLKLHLAEIRKGFVILKPDGVDSIAEAEKLIGQTVYIDRNDYELPEDVWFIGDLIGLTVTDADTGRVYGKVEEILQNAPKDVYVVKTESGKQLLFPAIPEVLLNVDIPAGIITIRPSEGLFEDYED